MAGVSTSTRDLEAVHERLRAWFAEREDDPGVSVSAFEEVTHSGFSNQTLFFTLDRAGLPPASLVLRLPPAGDGLFPSYDFEKQWRVQTMLTGAGLPMASPVRYEPDDAWLGAPFLVMPRISGHSPDDVTYMVKGWMHDQDSAVQRTCMESFAGLLCSLHSLEPGPYRAPLARPGGGGLDAELEWWHEYLLWASDGSPPAQMAEAYVWAYQTCPGNPYPDSVLWNDARLSNAVFHQDGRIAAALDWEQATIGPAEIDIGFWFATRRQTCEAMRIAADPELPGFPPRNELVTRLKERLGRPLHQLAWHELFAMIRMGTCIVGTQRVLRRSGHHDHFLMRAPLLPEWTAREMGLSR